MMNYELRLLQDELIGLINSHDNLPWEARRLVVEAVLCLIEKKADEAITREISEEGENAKNI